MRLIKRLSGQLKQCLGLMFVLLFNTIFILNLSDNLFITAAATQGIHLATTVLMSKDAPIFVEDPTFFIAHGMFQRDYEHRVIPG